MKTDNELIADFYCSQLGLKGVGLKDNHYYFGSIPVAYAYKGDLKFDTSWDWLMPVVEKIEEEDPDSLFIDIKYRRTDIEFDEFGIRHWVGKTKIESTYKAVVEFIKWYNKEKSNLK